VVIFLHTITTLILLGCVYKFADWKRIREYHATLIYIGYVNLLYLFLTAGFPMWQYEPDSFSNHTITEISNSLIFLPCVALLFLSLYPVKMKIWVYYSLWIAGSIVWEYIFVSFNKITFHNGWSFWVEPIFYLVMYIMIRLHYKRPIWAYIGSIIFVLVLLLIYNIPLDIPYYNR
jgi:hypothetical protein